MNFYTVRQIAFELNVNDCAISNFSKRAHLSHPKMIPAKIVQKDKWHRSFYSEYQLELFRLFYANLEEMKVIKARMLVSHHL